MSQETPTRHAVRMLDIQTINQIAAGEVVESPAAAVKELVENALDAGSTRILVELENSGKKLIRVTDNGQGMSATDAEIALERHATSKIRRVEDLAQISTLGFRGEAVPSIAAVSRMTIETATEDGARFCITVEGGLRGEPYSRAGAAGTVVSIEDLFFNTPARLRFLKSDTTELRLCVECVQRLAMSYHEVSFTLKHNGSVLMQTPGGDNAMGAIAAVWGHDLARAVVPVDRYSGGVRITGIVSPPHFTKSTRSYQWFFVNRRPIRSRSLAMAVEVAFRTLTPERRFPVCALWLDIDPARIDCNVSPTKTEVKFQDDGLVFDAVRHAIRDALLAYGMIPSAEAIANANQAIHEVTPQPSGPLLIDPNQPPQTPGLFAPGPEFSNAATPQGSSFGPAFREMLSRLEAQRESEGLTPDSGLPEAAPNESMDAFLDGLRVIGQSMNTFIIAQNKQGLLIIDQHVAHERILFEMLCGKRGQAPMEVQSLLVPATLNLEAQGAAILAEHLETVRAVGFDVEEFGAGTFLIRSVPAALRNRNPASVLQDIVEDLLETSGRERVVSVREKIWITCSCKMAIKAGDPLGMAEMERLLQDLALSENPYLCPHGRPITLLISNNDLLRKFKRA